MIDQKKLIWVVEDDEGIAEVLTILLEEEGYKIYRIDTMQGLNEALDTEIPGLIMLDILLSGMDGQDICRQLKQDPRTQHVPVLMMSADTQVEAKAKQAGADGFIKKPFDIDQVSARIKTFIN